MSDADVRPGRTVDVDVVARDGSAAVATTDSVVTEEPLEIRLVAARRPRTIAITMRTPGHDFELAAGFLYGEGVVNAREEIATITYCLDDDLDPDQRYNVVNVEL
ncbi:MAG: formate dehydrogenase accessory sulfurtransferase FdhD, partial [Candidatus Eremiobacteraeota bacterium]|nr:formate dehydrogenase accessory sulfurtransferase FdhD [Candidatus Eremiobacteraeota bacterium]